MEVKETVIKKSELYDGKYSLDINVFGSEKEVNDFISKINDITIEILKKG